MTEVDTSASPLARLFAQRRLRVEAGRVRGSGRPTGEELATLDSGALLVPLLASGVAVVGGADARPFLHGQLANDVTGLAVGGVTRSLMLNHKGHALAEAAVLRRTGDLLLAVDDGQLGPLLTSLERHVVFDEVNLAGQPDWLLLTLQGGGATQVLERLGGELPAERAFSLTQVAGLVSYSYRRARSAAGGYDLLVGPTGPGAVAALVGQLLAELQDAGATLTGEDALDAARVLAGIAGAASEAGEGVLPQEAGLEAALSYRKGCYLGQEIMARIEARGNLKRSLARLALSGRPAGAGENGRALVAGGRVVGVLGTVAELPDGSLGALAVIRADLPDGAAVEVGGIEGRLTR